MKEVPGPTNWGFASRLEPKLPGGYQHMFDLRPINLHLKVPKCKFETLSRLPFLSRLRNVGVAIDM